MTCGQQIDSLKLEVAEECAELARRTVSETRRCCLRLNMRVYCHWTKEAVSVGGRGPNVDVVGNDGETFPAATQLRALTAPLSHVTAPFGNRSGFTSVDSTTSPRSSP